MLLKATPGKVSKAASIIKNEPGTKVIALTQYIQWKLNQYGISSLLFNDLAQPKDIYSLHSLLEKKYTSLVRNPNRKQALNYADLFQTHLCWEIQNEYYFLIILQKWVRKFRVKKLHYEFIPLVKKKRYAKNINQLVGEYCWQNKVGFEVF